MSAALRAWAPALWPGSAVEAIRLAGHDAFPRPRLPGGEDEALYAALPDEGCLVVTPDRAALARTLTRPSTAGPEPPRRLADLARGVDPVRTPLWVVGAPKPTAGLAPFAGGLVFADGVRGSLTFTARTAEEARALEADLRELQDAAVESAKDQRGKGRGGEPLAAALARAEWARDGVKVEIRVRLSAPGSGRPAAGDERHVRQRPDASFPHLDGRGDRVPEPQPRLQAQRSGVEGLAAADRVVAAGVRQ